MQRVVLVAPLLALVAGCLAPAPPAASPVSPEAAAALAEARELRRQGAEPGDPGLRAAVARARWQAPDWVAPRRMEDDLRLAATLGVEALQGRLDLVRGDPRDPALQYLTGRLEQRRGVHRFERAVELDASFAWGYHGLAWAAADRGDADQAARLEKRARDLARDEWERCYFEVALAGYQMAASREEEALETLRTALARTGLEGGDRLWLEIETALVELRQPRKAARRDGHRRGLALLRHPALTDDDALRLVSAMRFPSEGDLWGYDLELALATVESPLRDQLRAELMLSRAASPIGTRLLERSLSERQADRDPIGRGVRFAIGEYRRGVERWLAGLPRQVLAADGDPADPRLRRIVDEARRLDAAGGPGSHGRQQLIELGAALIEAGWFVEARSVAEELARFELEPALALRERALAGLALIDSVRRSLYELEEGDGEDGLPPLAATALGRDEAQAAEERDEAQGGRSSLDQLLERVGIAVAHANDWLGGETDPGRASTELIASPRLEYGPFATLVHPGPRFSEADEECGLGSAGSPVGGLSAVMARLGRFGVFGQYLGGGGPDGTILRALRVEERHGRHLGVYWGGTIAWCEGADLSARAGRSGARISGAALHEGYWVDVGSVRSDLGRWRRLTERFEGPGAAEELGRVLATRGLVLVSTDPRNRSFERRQVEPLLGEADRVRLRVLRDRAGRDAAPERPLGSVGLTELVDAVACHEEGHLCDRTLFLPLGRKLGRVLRLVFAEGFSPAAIQRRLEYRAQLMALCVIDDPRISLVEVLAAAESTGTGPLPHAAAYVELLRDLVALLDEHSELDTQRWAHVDRDRTLVHQLHVLSPEEVRFLALALAKEKRVGRL